MGLLQIDSVLTWRGAYWPFMTYPFYAIHDNYINIFHDRSAGALLLSCKVGVILLQQTAGFNLFTVIILLHCKCVIV